MLVLLILMIQKTYNKSGSIASKKYFYTRITNTDKRELCKESTSFDKRILQKSEFNLTSNETIKSEPTENLIL